jgi:phosphopantothenoylcysteine decarboxylase/phosphopantothenate--cysteine ligase
LFLAHDRTKPFLVAPAMNPAMWQHPATQDSLEKLGRWGVRFISVGEGRTACGEVGEGRLAEPEDVIAAIEASLARPQRRLRVLVTSGGTSEPVDGVRVLSNTSTGATGSLIAGRMARAGHEVVLLRARNSIPSTGCREELFTSYADLEQALARLLSAEAFHGVIHAAAVSDFSVDEVTVDGRSVPPAGKLPSGMAPVIHLRTNPKLVDRLRAMSSRKELTVVAFKLTHGDAPGAVASLFAHSGADMVVHNDLSERMDAELFPSTIHFRGDAAPRRCATRTELADALESLLTASTAEETIPA